jgi:hypothetical protein
MSSWTDLYTKLYDADRTILGRLEILLTNQEEIENYLDHGTSYLLDEPLISLKTENFDFAEMPKEVLLNMIEAMKTENNELKSMLVQANKERKVNFDNKNP